MMQSHVIFCGDKLSMKSTPKNYQCSIIFLSLKLRPKETIKNKISLYFAREKLKSFRTLFFAAPEESTIYAPKISRRVYSN